MVSWDTALEHWKNGRRTVGGAHSRGKLMLHRLRGGHETSRKAVVTSPFVHLLDGESKN